MAQTILEYLWFFIIYAFIGYCIEVAFYTLKTGGFVNRGFLNGPVCPIYGFGMVSLLYLLNPIIDHVVLLFLASFFLTTVLEFITGFLLEKLFNDKWWDYSEEPFNIKGYVCLSFSIAWGLGAVFVLHIVHPFIKKLVSFTDNKIGYLVLSFLFAYFIVDLFLTLLGIMKIKKHIRLLDEIRNRMTANSDNLGENISRGMTKVVKIKDNIDQRLGDIKSEIDERIANYEDAKKQQESALKEKGFVHKRLEKAFPNIKERLSGLKKDKNNKIDK